MSSDMFTQGWADFSECGDYRYLLTRVWNPEGKKVLFVGLNPSTADAEHDDQTVGKWTGFSRRWGYGGFIVTNVFPYRSTDPKALADAELGLHQRVMNKRKITDAFREHDIDLLVPCWGNRSKVPLSMQFWFTDMVSWLRLHAVDKDLQLKCFGRTKSNDPIHPLMLGYDTELEDFR